MALLRTLTLIHAFPARTYLNLHNIFLTPKLFRKIKTSLYLSKTSGPNCFTVVVLMECECDISYVLAELFNTSLKESCFPGFRKVSSGLCM